MVARGNVKTEDGTQQKLRDVLPVPIYASEGHRRGARERDSTLRFDIVSRIALPTEKAERF
jgi:hypothetical protein